MSFCKDTPGRGRVLPEFVDQLSLTQQKFFDNRHQEALLTFNPPAGGGGPRPPVSEVLQFFLKQISNEKANVHMSGQADLYTVDGIFKRNEFAEHIRI